MRYRNRPIEAVRSCSGNGFSVSWASSEANQHHDLAVSIGQIGNGAAQQIIAWKAVISAGISGSDIRDIMVEAVERRLKALRAPATIEMLTDNGPPYIAKDSQIFARLFGLKLCFMPIRSPHSNGISEAFVKTLKRDCVQVTSLPNVQTVLELIGSWLEDYNDNHPHSGLKMRSPREFIAAQTATA